MAGTMDETQSNRRIPRENLAAALKRNMARRKSAKARAHSAPDEQAIEDSASAEKSA